jgi:hypothetical protein
VSVHSTFMRIRTWRPMRRFWWWPTPCALRYLSTQPGVPKVVS